MTGPDPREMAKADCVVIWGTNAVSTQVNVMTHAMRARKERGAKIVVVDIYRNDTMKQADLALCLKPGTDGALACAIMHALFRDGLADRAYLARYTDAPEELEAHLATRDPQWASAITGLPVAEIEAFAALGPARASAPIFVSAMAFRASATAPPICMRRPASPPSPAPGPMKAAALSTTMRRSIIGARR